MAIRVDDPLHERVDRLVVGLIAHPLSDRSPPGTVSGLGSPGNSDGAPHDRRPGEQQLAGDADADATTCPRDDGHLAVERAHRPQK